VETHCNNIRAVSGGDITMYDLLLVQVADGVCQLNSETRQLLYAQRLCKHIE